MGLRRHVESDFVRHAVPGLLTELLSVGDSASKFFMLGKIRVDDPDRLRAELKQLRAELLADPYFRDFPSMQPEARDLVDLDLEHGGRRGRIYNQKNPLFPPRDTDIA